MAQNLRYWDLQSTLCEKLTHGPLPPVLIGFARFATAQSLALRRQGSSITELTHIVFETFDVRKGSSTYQVGFLKREGAAKMNLTQTCADGAQMTLHALVPCTLLQHQACHSKTTHKRPAIRALLLVHVGNLVCGSYPLGCTLLPDPLERWLKHQILLHPCDKLHCSTAL